MLDQLAGTELDRQHLEQNVRWRRRRHSVAVHCGDTVCSSAADPSVASYRVFFQKGVIISTEQRSLRMVGGTNHVGKAPMSVMGFGPNIKCVPSFHLHGTRTLLPF